MAKLNYLLPISSRITLQLCNSPRISSQTHQLTLKQKASFFDFGSENSEKQQGRHTGCMKSFGTISPTREAALLPVTIRYPFPAVLQRVQKSLAQFEKVRLSNQNIDPVYLFWGLGSCTEVSKDGKIDCGSLGAQFRHRNVKSCTTK